MQAASQYNAGQATASLQRANTQIAQYSASGEAQAGAEQASIYRQHVNRVIGSEQAATGASGVASYGSNLAVQQSTAMIGAQDLERIRVNAQRKAWGFEVQGAGDELRGKLAAGAGTMGALSTLVTSGAAAYGDWSKVHPNG